MHIHRFVSKMLSPHFTNTVQEGILSTCTIVLCTLESAFRVSLVLSIMYEHLSLDAKPPQHEFRVTWIQGLILHIFSVYEVIHVGLWSSTVFEAKSLFSFTQPLHKTILPSLCSSSILLPLSFCPVSPCSLCPAFSLSLSEAFASLFCPFLYSSCFIHFCLLALLCNVFC